MTVFVLSSLASPLRAQFVSDPGKTDSLRVRNGDWVKWSRVLTAITSKEFEIHLGDGRRFIGSSARCGQVTPSVEW